MRGLFTCHSNLYFAFTNLIIIFVNMKATIKKTLLFLGLTLLLLGVVAAGMFAYNYKYRKVIITPIGKEVYFTTQYNPDAKTCVAAAYIDVEGKILGTYRIDGKTYQKPHYQYKASLTPKGLVIAKTWQSKSGFQQLTLVKSGKACTFRKDPNRNIRRALCNKADNKEEYYIIESTYPMTLTQFARLCSQHAYNAVNLDMGSCGYGKVNGRIRSLWAIFTRDEQTNWICVD